MSDILSALNLRDIGDQAADRMEAHQAEYEARFLGSYKGQLDRARREGVIAPSMMTFAEADPADPDLNRVGRNLLRNTPFALALRDELRARGKELQQDASPAELALAYAAYSAVEQRIDVGHTVRLDDDNSVRVRAVIDGRRDRVEARYARRTNVGTLEVASVLRRGLDKPTGGARVSLRNGCDPRPMVCGSIDLTHDTHDDAQNSKKVTALTAHRIYKNGWMLTAGVERVRAEHTNDTHVFVGAIYGGSM